MGRSSSLANITVGSQIPTHPAYVAWHGYRGRADLGFSLGRGLEVPVDEAKPLIDRLSRETVA